MCNCNKNCCTCCSSKNNETTEEQNSSNSKKSRDFFDYVAIAITTLAFPPLGLLAIEATKPHKEQEKKD